MSILNFGLKISIFDKSKWHDWQIKFLNFFQCGSCRSQLDFLKPTLINRCSIPKNVMYRIRVVIYRPLFLSFFIDFSWQVCFTPVSSSKIEHYLINVLFFNIWFFRRSNVLEGIKHLEKFITFSLSFVSVKMFEKICNPDQNRGHSYLSNVARFWKSLNLRFFWVFRAFCFEKFVSKVG